MLKNTQGQTLQKCSRCHSVKLQERFFSINVKGDYKKSCDKCLDRHNTEQKRYSKRNKDKIRERQRKYYNNPETQEKIKQYNEVNKVKIRERHKKYNEKNKEYLKKQKKEYKARPEVKDRIKQWTKQYSQDKRNHCEHNCRKGRCKICSPLGHLKDLASHRVHSALNSINKKKDNRTIEYLGCNINTFKNWIERQFTSEMNWDNIGDVWQIDHYVPVLYKMNKKSPRESDVIRRLHYMNTQPMLNYQNMSKGNRYIGGYKPDF